MNVRGKLKYALRLFPIQLNQYLSMDIMPRDRSSSLLMTIVRANLGSYGPTIRRIQDGDELINVRQSRHSTRCANAYHVASFERCRPPPTRALSRRRGEPIPGNPRARAAAPLVLTHSKSAARAMVLPVCVQILQKGLASLFRALSGRLPMPV
jgi:hypothetical protein